MILVLIGLILALPALPECITIAGDTIMVQDLAKAVPAFASAPAAEVLSFAPIPGLTRSLRVSEIAMFARRFNVSYDKTSARDVCFESAAAALTEGQIRAAILSSIPAAVVSLTVLDFSRLPVPPGVLEFRPGGLAGASSGSAAATVWQGRVKTTSGRSFPIWAKITVLIQKMVVVSTRALEKNHVLTPEDLAYSNEAPFPLPQGILDSTDGLAGQIVLSGTLHGAPILKSMLVQPWEVEHGEVVRVSSICGDAHLSFEARAQMSGRRGDSITVLNPNGRSFRARVIGKGQVEVRSAAGA